MTELIGRSSRTNQNRARRSFFVAINPENSCRKETERKILGESYKNELMNFRNKVDEFCQFY